jgi:hypothetical protein
MQQQDSGGFKSEVLQRYNASIEALILDNTSTSEATTEED